MIVKTLFAAHPVVRPLYERAVGLARNPELYSRMAVPDTVRGRLELIYLHVFLLLRPLDDSDPADRRFLDAFFHHMFKVDLDPALRELGVGDMSISRRIRRIGQDYYGRAAAYHEALAISDDSALCQAMAAHIHEHTLPAEAAPVRALAQHVRVLARQVSATPKSDLLAGRLAELADGTTQDTGARLTDPLDQGPDSLA